MRNAFFMIPFVELCFAEITGSGFHAQASGLTRRGGWLTLHLLTAESFDWNDLSVRIWWNWQTRYFEVVVGQPVQVQVLLCAPNFNLPSTIALSLHILHCAVPIGRIIDDSCCFGTRAAGS